MFGKPLISAEIGTGTSYININGKTGLTVNPSDPKSLREAMDNLWNNPVLTREFGRNAKIRFEKLFTSNMMGRAYADIYNKLVNQK